MSTMHSVPPLPLDALGDGDGTGVGVGVLATPTASTSGTQTEPSTMRTPSDDVAIQTCLDVHVPLDLSVGAPPVPPLELPLSAEREHSWRSPLAAATRAHVFDQLRAPPAALLRSADYAQLALKYGVGLVAGASPVPQASLAVGGAAPAPSLPRALSASFDRDAPSRPLPLGKLIRQYIYSYVDGTRITVKWILISHRKWTFTWRRRQQRLLCES